MTDRNQVDHICLKTGDAGEDATGKHADDQLLSYVYAFPYLEHASRWAWVVVEDDTVLGYVLGVPNAAAFRRWWRASWAPALEERFPAHERKRWPLADQQLFDSALVPEVDNHWEDQHPAELHVDILPAGQGRGLGRKLVETLLQELKHEGVPGLALGVDAENTNAIRFYDRLGFKVLSETRDGDKVTALTMAVKL